MGDLVENGTKGQRYRKLLDDTFMIMIETFILDDGLNQRLKRLS